MRHQNHPVAIGQIVRQRVVVRVPAVMLIAIGMPTRLRDGRQGGRHLARRPGRVRGLATGAAAVGAIAVGVGARFRVVHRVDLARARHETGDIDTQDRGKGLDHGPQIELELRLEPGLGRLALVVDGVDAHAREGHAYEAGAVHQDQLDCDWRRVSVRIGESSKSREGCTSVASANFNLPENNPRQGAGQNIDQDLKGRVERQGQDGLEHPATPFSVGAEVELAWNGPGTQSRDLKSISAKII